MKSISSINVSDITFHIRKVLVVEFIKLFND